jgi:hypothetical protein
MKSEVLKITEKGSEEYRELEIVLKVENDAGEILPEYIWTITPDRAKEVLESEDEMENELALATSEALDYIQRDKTLVENPVVEEKELDKKNILTEKVKKGLTKEGIEEYKEKNKPRPADMLQKDRKEQMAKGIIDENGVLIQKEETKK